MGGEKRPGPICIVKVGEEWVDGGTLCRTRSGSPGITGKDDEFAPPKRTPEQEAEIAQDRVLLKDNIERIGRSPFGRKPEGQRIVKRLNTLLRGGHILYEPMGEGVRGGWDGTDIVINAEFRQDLRKTISELVHEGTHAAEKSVHPSGRIQKDRFKSVVDDEMRAVENQLEIYRYLKSSWGFEDAVLEERLRRQAAGTLRATVEQQFEALRSD